ncbi:hypothetical protein VTI74DRAFT_9643 [Chaetomium olivicolor]
MSEMRSLDDHCLGCWQPYLNPSCNLEVQVNDENEDEFSSGTESEASSSNASVNPNPYKFVQESGRTSHK